MPEERYVYANLASLAQSGRLALCRNGATFTGAAVKDDSLDLVQVGDSRGYIISQRSDSSGNEGPIAGTATSRRRTDKRNRSRNSHVPERYSATLGAQSEVTPVTGRIRLRQGDMLLLCSDGLSGKLRSEDIQQLILNSDGRSGEGLQRAGRRSNNRGGEDNIMLCWHRFASSTSALQAFARSPSLFKMSC